MERCGAGATQAAAGWALADLRSFLERQFRLVLKRIGLRSPAAAITAWRSKSTAPFGRAVSTIPGRSGTTHKTINTPGCAAACRATTGWRLLQGIGKPLQ